MQSVAHSILGSPLSLYDLTGGTGFAICSPLYYRATPVPIRPDGWDRVRTKAAAQMVGGYMKATAHRVGGDMEATAYRVGGDMNATAHRRGVDMESTAHEVGSDPLPP